MKKLYLLLSAVLITLVMNAQLNVIYFNKDKIMDPTAGADPLLTTLQADSRFVVTVNSNSSSAAPDVSSYDLVILSEVLTSDDAVLVSLEGVNARLLNMKVYGYKAAVWNWGSPSDGPGPDIKIVEGKESHPIFKNVSITDGKVTLFKRTTDDNGGAGSKATNYAYELATITGDVERLAYPDGATELDAVNIQAIADPTATIGGTTIPKKYVMLGFNYGAMCADNSTNMTEAGSKIIMNAVEWLVADLLPSSIDNKFSNQLNAYGIQGNIRIVTNKPTNVSIYSIDGRLIKEIVVNSTSNIPCKNGLYIVNVAGAGVSKVYVSK